MTAAGKTTAARVTTGDRVLVKRYSMDNEADRATLEYLGVEAAIGISTTKTGEGVTVARVLKVEARMLTGGRRDRRVYDIHTTEGVLGNNAPAQTLTLAPEDPAGIKRAHVEAIAEDRTRAAAIAQAEMDEATANQATPQYRYFAEASRANGGYLGAMRALEIEAHAELADRNWAAIQAARTAPEPTEAAAGTVHLEPMRTRFHGKTPGQRRARRKAQRAARRTTRANR